MSSKRPRWRSTCYPLLLVGSAIFFYILYRIFPSMFLLLVKSFPIALCTALLLGILLIHGGPSIPPAKEEEEGGRHIVIKNQESVCNAVNRRNAIGEVEEKEWRADFMALAERNNNNAAKQLGARFETTSCLVNDAKYTRRTPAEVSEPTRSSRRDLVHRRGASSDSENDDGESSAASDADLLPLLDELDPLLDPEADLAAGSNSDACSQDRDSNDDSSMTEEIGIQDDEDEDEDDDEEAHEEKEDDSKAAVTWTADDQSNLVHLGNSELERNIRLESLIERRRSMKITEKKNLIDSLPIMEEITRLSTLRSSIYDPRKNPFDLPYDADDNVPDSAPVLLQRQNPFHQVERDDMGPQESSIAPSRDALFTRHESFTVGASFFGDLDHDRDRFAYRFKPYFSTEIGEDEGILSDLHRQLSDMNGSNVSSTADSDAASSVTDQEDAHQENRKLVAESNDEASFISSNGVVESTDMEQVMNERSVEQTHQSTQVLGGTEDDSTSEEDQEVDLTVSDAVENIQELDEDTETRNTPSPSKSGDMRSEEQTADAKDEMGNAFSHDSTKEVDEEYGNMNAVPVYDSSPSATDKSRSTFSTELDEILLPADNTNRRI